MASTGNLVTITDSFTTEDEARAFLEGLRWPDGAVCPHCGATEPYKITPKPGSKTRKGLYKCRAKGCRKQFTVTVGTIFEDSHIPLRKWLMAIHLLCASKKGMSAHQLHRMLGVTYKTAWFMCHRIRYAMTQEPLASKLQGTVEVDETYVGGRVRVGSKRGKIDKPPVVALVERGGDVRAFPMPLVTEANLRQAIRDHVEPSSRVMTDGHYAYRLQPKLDLETFGVVIRKDKAAEKHPDIDPREIAWERLLQRIERFSTKSQTPILLTHDDRDASPLIRKLARKARRAGIAPSRLGTGFLKVPAKLLIDDPVPRDSSQSYLIQLADLSAYAAFRRVVAPGAKVKRIVAQGMWDELGDARLAAVNMYSKGATGPTGIVTL